MPVDADLILVGGGLANGLLAWQLHQRRPAMRVLVVEQGRELGGNHTWSFHSGDLDERQQRWLQPLVAHRWPAQDVRFPGFTRRLESGYASIASAGFHRVLMADLADAVRLEAPVVEVHAREVLLADGQRLCATAVIDGRGPRASRHLALGYQKFLGQEVRLAAPHGLTVPVIMDATVDQQDGYRFVYVLPLSADCLLIEDTYYADAGELPVERLRENLQHYARDRCWQIADVLREEQGVLPIVLSGDIQAFWEEAGEVPRSGLAAALFHPTTGYSLPDAVRLVDHLIATDRWDADGLYATLRAYSCRLWQQRGFFRLLNRMLFLAGPADRRWQVMQRFYRLPGPLIERFYAARLTLLDRARIVSGKPPVPIGEALRALAAHDLHCKDHR